MPADWLVDIPQIYAPDTSDYWAAACETTASATIDRQVVVDVVVTSPSGTPGIHAISAIGSNADAMEIVRSLLARSTVAAIDGFISITLLVDFLGVSEAESADLAESASRHTADRLN